MSRFSPINPKPFLSDLQGLTVVVCLKWGQEYRGVLQAFDSYFNIQLLETEEFQDGISTGVLGEVLIRCNNVLWISQEPGVVTNHGTAREGLIQGDREATDEQTAADL
ncbi:Manganese transporter smf1 [Savitreella phatthalungensis]